MSRVSKSLDVALKHRKAGRLAQAERICANVAAKNPGHAGAQNDLGNVYQELGRYREAIARYDLAIEADPHYAFAYNNKGNALSSLGQCEAALSQYGKAIFLRPDYALAHNNLGNALRRLGRLEEAVESFRNAIALSPEYAKAHRNLGNALIELGKEEEGLASLRTASRLAPHDAQLRIDLAAALKLRGRTEDALAELRSAVEQEPQNGAAACELGLLLLDCGRYEEAIAHLQRAVQIDPKDATAFNALGTIHLDHERVEEAKDCYAKAIAIRPRFHQALNNLANALARQGRTEDAIVRYRECLEISPKFAVAHNNLGNALLDAGRVDEAISCYQRARELDPAYRQARINLRRAYSRQVRRWHFPMLADRARNRAYRKAIEKAVGPSSRVLDIGAGSGLLSLMAARAGASKVVACESVRAIADAARDIVRENGYERIVEIVNKRSTELVVGVDLDQPANVLISEILDVGLLGEGVIPSHRHALSELLTDDPIVIPRSARLVGMLVEMPELRAAHPVRTIEGFDLSAFDRFRNPEAYLTVHLRSEAHRQLTEVFAIETFDLADPPAPAGRWTPRRRQIETKAVANGSAHGIAFWFELRLDDEITVSSAIDGELRHWGQAIQYFDEDRELADGDRVSLTACLSDRHVHFQL